jgi:hypothetical protein
MERESGKTALSVFGTTDLRKESVSTVANTKSYGRATESVDIQAMNKVLSNNSSGVFLKSNFVRKRNTNNETPIEHNSNKQPISIIISTKQRPMTSKGPIKPIEIATMDDNGRNSFDALKSLKLKDLAKISRN